MSLYQRHIVPHLIHTAMRSPRIAPYRAEIAGEAQGRVLEIGIGSALNLGHYGPKVSALVGVEPSALLRRKAERALLAAAVPAELVAASAENLPFDRASFDTVVSSWTLCSITDVARALREVRRVIKPEGSFLFVEHGLSADAGVGRWQDRLDPLWGLFSGGCHLNRPIARFIEAAGFSFDSSRTEYAEGPRILTYLYIGRARPA